jgi:PAS domain-containing protein
MRAKRTPKSDNMSYQDGTMAMLGMAPCEQMGVILCTQSKSLAAALTRYLESTAAQQTDNGLVPAYPLQVISPGDLPGVPDDLSHAVILISVDDQDQALHLLEIAMERVPGAAVIIVMSEFDTNAESRYLRYGAFDVIFIPEKPSMAAQAIFTRLQRAESLTLQLAKNFASEQQSRMTISVLDRALSMLPQAVTVVDGRGYIEYVNKAMVKLTQATHKTMVGARFSNWIQPDEAEEGSETKYLIETTSPKATTLPVTLKKTAAGKISSEMSAVTVTLEGHKKYILIINNAKADPHSEDDLLGQIYNLHSFSRNNRSRFIQWVDDVANQVCLNDEQSLTVITVRLCHASDINPEDAERFVDSIADEAASFLSILAVDYGFGIWDHGVLAIGVVANGTQAHRSIISRLEMVVESHQYTASTLVRLEGVQDIDNPSCSQVLESIQRCHQAEPSKEIGMDLFIL